MCGVAELPLYRVPVCIVFFKALYQHVSTCIILNIFSAVVKSAVFMRGRPVVFLTFYHLYKIEIPNQQLSFMTGVCPQHFTPGTLIPIL